MDLLDLETVDEGRIRFWFSIIRKNIFFIFLSFFYQILLKTNDKKFELNLNMNKIVDY